MRRWKIKKIQKKKIFLQAYLAGKGARAGKGWKSREGLKPVAFSILPGGFVYIIEMYNGQLFLTSQLLTWLIT